jgi:hypothetical protein
MKRLAFNARLFATLVACIVAGVVSSSAQRDSPERMREIAKAQAVVVKNKTSRL